MARPRRCRRICIEPDYVSFIPEGNLRKEKVILTVDEYETIRLIDLEKFTHEQCANQMDISRTTVTEVYKSAREKISDSIVNGKPLLITGGDYRICDGLDVCYCQKTCRKASSTVLNETVQMKGADEMRIAVTYENGKVFQHFGHTEKFKLYDIEDGKIKKEQIENTDGSGHGAISGFLAGLKVDVLICGGIGNGAKEAITQAEIKLYGGVTGETDKVVKEFLEGSLNYNPDIQCAHHDHEHNENHNHDHCGEDKHGCSGNGGNC